MRKLVLMIVGLMAAAFAQAATLTLTNGEWAPYMSEKLKHNGIASYIVQEAFALEGDQVQYKFLPWKRGFEDAKKGIDAQGSLIWTKNAEREQAFYFSAPVMRLKDVLFYRAGENVSWDKIEDLAKYKFGGVAGYSYIVDDLVKQGILKMSRVSSAEANYKKLLAGRIDVIQENEDVGFELVNKLGMAGKIISSEKALREVDYFLLISKKVPDGEVIVERFNRGLAKLKESGRYQQMIEDSRQGKYK